VEHRVDVDWLVDRFGLELLPVESTYFVRTYTSSTRAADGSAAGSAIVGLFAREPRSRSLFHTVSCDEMWHFYAGGQQVQHLVPAGVWQAGELVEGGEWALFGCTVTPEFTTDAFRGGHADDLLATHPSCVDDIVRLSVPAGVPLSLPGATGRRAQDS
jgi:predicted cupin superfamily sugar epimerase